MSTALRSVAPQKVADSSQHWWNSAFERSAPLKSGAWKCSSWKMADFIFALANTTFAWVTFLPR